MMTSAEAMDRTLSRQSPKRSKTANRKDLKYRNFRLSSYICNFLYSPEVGDYSRPILNCKRYLHGRIAQGIPEESAHQKRLN